MKTVLVFLMLLATAVATLNAICLAEKDSVAATKVKEFPITVDLAVFSSDAKTVAFCSQYDLKNPEKERTISLYSVDGKEVLSATIRQRFYHMCFSKDGKRLLMQSRDDTVHELDTKTGKVMRTREGKAEFDLRPSEAKSSNAKLTAKIEREEKTDVTRLSVTRDSTQLFWIYVGGGQHMPLRFLRFSPDGKRLALCYHFHGGLSDEQLLLGEAVQDVETDPYFTRSFVIIHDAMTGNVLHTESLWHEYLHDVYYGSDGMLLLTTRAGWKNVGRPTLWLLKK